MVTVVYVLLGVVAAVCLLVIALDVLDQLR